VRRGSNEGLGDHCVMKGKKENGENGMREGLLS
jgi:hypothetical protein